MLIWYWWSCILFIQFCLNLTITNTLLIKEIQFPLIFITKAIIYSWIIFFFKFQSVFLNRCIECVKDLVNMDNIWHLHSLSTDRFFFYGKVISNLPYWHILSLIYPHTSPALPPIYIYIYTELAPKLTATASVAQSVERWSRDPGSRVGFPTGGLEFFATGPGWVLKWISFWHSNLPYFKKKIYLQ